MLDTIGEGFEEARLIPQQVCQNHHWYILPTSSSGANEKHHYIEIRQKRGNLETATAKALADLRGFQGFQLKPTLASTIFEIQ